MDAQAAPVVAPAPARASAPPSSEDSQTLAAPDTSGPSGGAWRELQEVRCHLTAEVSAAGFTVRDLLLLQKGTVVSSNQSARAIRATQSRIAVCVNGSRIALGQFEVIEKRLGVRLTEIV